MRRLCWLARIAKILTFSLISSIFIIIVTLNLIIPIQINQDISFIVKQGKILSHSKNFDEKPVKIFGSIDKEKAISVIGKIEYQKNDPKIKEIHIILISNGGEVEAGLAIIQTIRGTKKPVTIHAMKALSMAAIILASGDKGKRWIKNSRRVAMIHLAHSKNPEKKSFWASFSKKILYFSPARIYKEKFIKILSQKSSLSRNKIKEDLEKSIWFTGQEAVKFGLADSVFSHLQIF